MKRIIPKKNIRGLRFGQILFNALEHANIWYREDYGNETYIGQNKDIFYIDNDKLEKIMQDFLKFYSGTCELNEKKRKKSLKYKALNFQEYFAEALKDPKFKKLYLKEVEKLKKRHKQYLEKFKQITNNNYENGD